MTTPMSNKSSEIKSLIEAVFPGTMEAIDNKTCPYCHSTVGAFKDEVSRKEYLISGWCQPCQDRFFG